MPAETSAGIVVFFSENKEIKYLLLHYSEGHWDFPKGHVEGIETLEQAALRETKEETGLEVPINEGFKEHISYFYKNRQGVIINKTVYFFVGQSATKEVKLSFEHIGYAWHSYENALKKLTYENAKEILRKANAFLVQKTLGDY
jgi:bis(5'-nucleosidyl)-tetraphosphatase